MEPSKCIGDCRLIRPGWNEVRAAKRGKEVVHCNFVRDVHDCEAQSDLMIFRVGQVVRPQGDIEQVAGLYTIGVVIIILFACLRQCEQR